MYRIDWRKELPALGLIVLAVIATLSLYPGLPDKIPTHWNIYGRVDRMADKNLWTALSAPLIAAALFGLTLFLPFIGPKNEKYRSFERPYRIIRYALVILLCAIQGITLAVSLGLPFRVERIVPGLVSLLFIVIGNVMGKTRRNWFVGFRFAWTMEDDEVWNKTNRLGGRLFVICGLMGLVGCLLPPVWANVLLLAPLLATVVITSAYSYFLFQRRKAQDGRCDR